eukprot:TRINITY_DN90937_c0_g1_i1.p1 TRINITY_DN90937_c0_g1~~TRINITY_DN90937_c0_g1_i1.p1  ORF type:complete len:467 (+),score=85.94 TRINITY_DN90937_c0_g1_i1:45-1445(+)
MSLLSLSEFKLRYGLRFAPGAGPDVGSGCSIRLVGEVAAVRVISNRILFLDIAADEELQQVCLRADLCRVQNLRDLEVIRQGLARGTCISVLGIPGKTAGGRDDGLTVFATSIRHSKLTAGESVEVLIPEVDDCAQDNLVCESQRAATEAFVLLRLAYWGCWEKRVGWQRQDPGREEAVPSVQGLVEKALCTVLRQECLVVQASSRTDRGVHARDQVAIVRLPDGYARGTDGTFSDQHDSRILNHDSLVTMLNQTLPCDIVVKQCAPVGNKRQQFAAKRYHYYVLQPPRGTSAPSALAREAWPYAWFVQRPLDIGSMRKAMEHIVGTHDFHQLASEKGHQNTQRTILSSDVEIYPLTSQFVDLHFGLRGSRPQPCIKNQEASDCQVSSDQVILIQVVGTGFLKHMVRRIVGTLKLVGEGKLSPADLLQMVDGQMEGGPAAPPRGLWLDRVWTEDESMDLQAGQAGR